VSEWEEIARLLAAEWLREEGGYGVRSSLGDAIKWSWALDEDSPEHVDAVIAWAKLQVAERAVSS
jgi:hypothetical protein